MQITSAFSLFAQGTGRMAMLPFNERCAAEEALASFERLANMDDLWTECLSQTNTIPPRHVDVLTRLVASMRRELKAAESHAEMLQVLLASYPEEFRAGFSSVLALGVLNSIDVEK